MYIYKTKINCHDYSFVYLGYAIIQFPELLLTIYKRLNTYFDDKKGKRNLSRSGNFKRSNIKKASIKSFTVDKNSRQ